MKKTLAAVLVILVLFLGISALVVTYPDEYMLVKQFGEIVRVEEKPGVSFKVPVIQEAESLPKCMQIYDIPKSDVITRDKKTMIADAFVLWRINDPVKFTRYLNGQLAQAQSRISASVFSSLKSVISNMDQSAIIEKPERKAGPGHPEQHRRIPGGLRHRDPFRGDQVPGYAGRQQAGGL